MWKRIVTAVVAGGGFLAVLIVGGNVYLALMAAIATIGFSEFCQIIGTSLLRVESIIGLLYLWAIFFLIAVPLAAVELSPFTVTIFFLFIGLIWTVLSRNHVTFNQVAYLLIGAMYIGVGFAFMTYTRFLTNGLLLTLFVIAVTWTSDSGAYFVGKRWGKRKLWPAISPNKTIAGSMAAIVCAILTGLVFWLFFAQIFTLRMAVTLSIIISIVGQVGDLIESALKRAHDVKDSGSLLPGHGGMLDRFDSLLFTFVVLHLLQMLG